MLTSHIDKMSENAAFIYRSVKCLKSAQQYKVLYNLDEKNSTENENQHLSEMASEFETILVQEDLNPVIKLEPLTSCDHNEKNSHQNYSTAAEESKIGEIFHVTKDHFKFVCAHCFAEFPLLVQFTAHVQQHLQEIYSEPFDTKSLNATDIKHQDSEAGSSFETEVHFDDDYSPAPSRKKRIKVKKGLKNHREMFRCTICNIKIAYKGNMLRHLKRRHRIKGDLDINYEAENMEENDTGLLKCSECSETFTDSTALKQHWNAAHGIKFYSCQICGKLVKNREKHLKNYHPEEKLNIFSICEVARQLVTTNRNKFGLYECSDCTETFKFLCMLIQHRDRVHIGRKFKCNICSARFAYRNLFCSHMSRRHPTAKFTPPPVEGDAVTGSNADRPYQCPICKQGYRFKNGFKLHLNQVHPAVRFEFKSVEEQMTEAHLNNKPSETISAACTTVVTVNDESIVAPQVSKSEQKLIINESRIGHRYQASECTICNLKFDNKWAHTWHNRHEHLSSERGFECYLCRSIFDKVAELKIHFRKAHVKNIAYIYQKYKNRERKCAKCGAKFTNINLLNRHKRWHKEEVNGRQYKCTVCLKAYVEPGELKRHMDTHWTDKCKICNKSVKKFYMKGHLLRHSNEHRVQCPVCAKSISDSAKLATHMRTHTGELPYACEYCGKLFRQSSGLVVHKRSHTGEYIHYCKPCEKGFLTRRQFRKHNLRLHGIKIDDENYPN